MKARKANLLCLLGIALVMLSLRAPWIDILSPWDFSVVRETYTLSDMVTGIPNWHWTFGSYYYDMFVEGVALLLASMALSLVTPLGGLVMVVATFRVWFIFPILFSGEFLPMTDLEYGVWLAVAGSVMVTASVFLRVLVGTRKVEVSLRPSEIRKGFYTFPSEPPIPIVSPRHRAAGPNMIAIAGILVGLGSLLSTWGEYRDGYDFNGLDILMDSYNPFYNLVWSGMYSHLSQACLVMFVSGLLLSVRSPLFGIVELAGVSSFWWANYSGYYVIGTPGPLIGVASSLIVIHSLVLHLNFSWRPCLVFGGHNIHTYVSREERKAKCPLRRRFPIVKW